MNMRLSLAALLLSATVYAVSAIDRICINSDNRIEKLYVDGEDYTRIVGNKKNVKKCSCIRVPVNSGVIAMQAENYKGADGIQLCNTANPTILSPWRCRDYKKTRKNWFRPRYNDRLWKRARRRRCKPHCHKYYKFPCSMSQSRCIWTRKHARIVRCRLKQCADNCYTCKNAGFGKCDPGQCVHGEAASVLTNEVSCKRQCRLEVKLWDSQGTSGYIRVGDVLTKYKDAWYATSPGYYLAKIDIRSCAVASPIFGTFDEASAIRKANLFAWRGVYTGPDDIYNIAVELGVGLPTAPRIGIWELGLGTILAPNSSYGVYPYTYFSALYTGIPNFNVTVTEVTYS